MRPVILEHPELPPARGMTGLAHYSGGLLAVMQTQPVRLVHFSRQYRVENVWMLSLARDVHSLAVRDNKVFLASTGNDSVLEFEPASGERVLWRLTSGEKDTIHLNSILWHAGNLFATAFGKKKGEQWSSADAGYLINLTTGRTVVSPLYHPHSAVGTGEGIYYCESSRMTIGREDGRKLAIGLGYIRGLVITDDYLYVGTSKGRTQSHSTGKVIDNSADPGLLAGRCGVLVYRRDNEKLEECELVEQASLEDYGEEIYDLLPL